MRLRILTLLTSLGLLSGCSISESEIAGIYARIPSVYTSDSLFLYSDTLQPTKVSGRRVFKYIQKLYDKNTGEMLLENRGTWWLNKNGRIELNNLYYNTDNDPANLSYSESAIKNSLISSSLPVSGSKIFLDEDLNVFYKKIGSIK